MGGAAGVGFLVICLLFAKNLMKKKHDGTFSLLALIHICMYTNKPQTHAHVTKNNK